MYQNENAFEFNPEMSSFENEQYENEQYENQQHEQFEFGVSERGEVFNENEVMELAAEFLEITNEAELDRFLGDFMNNTARKLSVMMDSPTGQALGGVLKGVAKKALPIAGGALGAYFGGPLGAKIGSGLASAAGSALGLEQEAMSQEDREFEGGKQFVRLAANTIKNAVSAPSSADPRRAAQIAATKAAQIYAPNLLDPGLRSAAPSNVSGKGRRGRWIRQGRNIIIVNC